MLAQPVVPVTSVRLVAALTAMAPEVHSSTRGGHLVEIGGELIRVEHRPDRPFALLMSTRWRRRLPVDHGRKLRELVDELNRDGILRTTVSVTDRGELDVRIALTHVVAAGASDDQLTGWLRRGGEALLAALQRLDHDFPEPPFVKED